MVCFDLVVCPLASYLCAELQRVKRAVLKDGSSVGVGVEIVCSCFVLYADVADFGAAHVRVDCKLHTLYSERDGIIDVARGQIFYVTLNIAAEECTVDLIRSPEASHLTP